MKINDKNFFECPPDQLAEKLIGKFLCRKVDGKIIKDEIIETEAYFGPEDSASHARFGKTERNKLMWDDGGTIYVYLCYGIHEMFNIVSGRNGEVGAVLIRETISAKGPGLLTKKFKINRQLNGEKIINNNKIWIENNCEKILIKKEKRIGINFAKDEDKNALLRYLKIIQK